MNEIKKKAIMAIQKIVLLQKLASLKGKKLRNCTTLKNTNPHSSSF
jgi:hypothetical protein